MAGTWDDSGCAMGWARARKLSWGLGVSTMAAICNKSSNNFWLRRKDWSIESGRFHSHCEPAWRIDPGKSTAFFHRKKEGTMCGSIGKVRYDVIYTVEEKEEARGTITFEWKTPYSGSNEARVKIDGTAQSWVSQKCERGGTSSSPEITFTLDDSESVKLRLKEKAEADAKAAAVEEERRKERAEAARKAAVAEEERRQERADAAKKLKDEQLKVAKTERDGIEAAKDRVEQDLDAAQKDHAELKERLKEKERQVKEEEAEISEFKDEREDPDTKLIVMLGKTGSGKSTTANRILGDTSENGNGDGSDAFFVASDEPESCTQTNRKKTVTINQHKISVVDTPGFSDSTKGKDRVHGINLCRYIKGCGGINAFVFVHKEPRFSSDFQNMLDAYHEMFGDAFFTRLVIVFAGYDSKKQKRDWAKQPEGKRGLTGSICDHYGLHFEIPAIPIGIEPENYKGAVTELVDKIRDDKLVIERIKSPLDDTKKQYAALKEQELESLEKVLALQEQHLEKKTQWQAACDKVQSLSSE